MKWTYGRAAFLKTYTLTATCLQISIQPQSVSLTWIGRNRIIHPDTCYTETEEYECLDEWALPQENKELYPAIVRPRNIKLIRSKKSWQCLVHWWKGVHVNFTGRVCPSIAFTRPTVLRYANKEIPRGSDRQPNKRQLKGSTFDHPLNW